MSGATWPVSETPSDADDARADQVESAPVAGASLVMGAPAPGDATALERFAAAMHDTMRSHRTTSAD